MTTNEKNALRAASDNAVADMNGAADRVGDIATWCDAE